MAILIMISLFASYAVYVIGVITVTLDGQERYERRVSYNQGDLSI